MFESVKQGSRLNAVMYATSLMASLAAHAAILLVLVVMPLVFFNVLHADELLTFLYEPPPPLPTPPQIPTAPRAVAANPGRVVSVSTIDIAPDRIPKGLPPVDDNPVEIGIERVIQGIGSPESRTGGGNALASLMPAIESPLLTPPPPIKRTPIIPGGNVQEAKLIFRVNPVYPEIARRTHVSGSVILEAVIDEEGNVSEVKILSGHPFLTEAAVQAVKQWKYSPTVLNGEPVPVMATVTVIFQIR